MRGVGSFATEAEYGRFLLARLKRGSRLMAVAGGHKGDSGAFIETDGSDSRPCKVEWDGSGSYDWVDWREIELEVRAHTPHTHHPLLLLMARGTIPPRFLFLLNKVVPVTFRSESSGFSNPRMMDPNPCLST
jgi:hypothetical protein